MPVFSRAGFFLSLFVMVAVCSQAGTLLREDLSTVESVEVKISDLSGDYLNPGKKAWFLSDMYKVAKEAFGKSGIKIVEKSDSKFLATLAIRYLKTPDEEIEFAELTVVLIDQVKFKRDESIESRDGLFWPSTTWRERKFYWLDSDQIDDSLREQIVNDMGFIVSRFTNDVLRTRDRDDDIEE